MRKLINFLDGIKNTLIQPRNHKYSVNRPTKMQIIVWVIVLIACIMVSLYDYQSFQIGSWKDDKIYAILAKSLIESDKYGIISVPGNEPFPAPYPFGYPLTISPFIILFPDNINALKIPSLIATIVNITLLFWGWRLFSRRSHWWGLAVIGLYAFQLQTIWHTRMVMSDPIFITFYLLAMILAEQAVQGAWNWRRRILMGLFLTFLIFTRTLGVLFLISIFLYLLFVDVRRFLKDLLIIPVIMIIIVIFIVTFTPVQITNLVPERYLAEQNLAILHSFTNFETSSNQYIEELLPSSYIYPVSQEIVKRDSSTESPESGGLFQLLKYSIIQHLGLDIRQVVIPFGGGDSEKEQALIEKYGVGFLSVSIGYVISIIILIGFAYWFIQEGISIFNLSAVVYFIPLMFWVWIGPRFLYPIQAQIFYALLLGIEIIWLSIAGIRLQRDVAMKLGKEFLIFIVISLITIFSYKSLTIEDTRLHLGDFSLRTSWTKTLEVDSTAIIMTEAPLIDYVYGGRKTMPPPRTSSDDNNLKDYLAKYEIDYILIAPKVDWVPQYTPIYSESTTRMLPIVEELISEKQLTLVYSADEELIKVYKTNNN